MARILEQPILRQGRQFTPPEGLDEMAKLLDDSPAGTQVTNDETYKSRHQAQVKAGQYKYWLKRMNDLDVTTATASTDNGKTWFFGVRLI